MVTPTRCHRALFRVNVDRSDYRIDIFKLEVRLSKVQATVGLSVILLFCEVLLLRPSLECL